MSRNLSKKLFFIRQVSPLVTEPPWANRKKRSKNRQTQRHQIHQQTQHAVKQA